MNKVGKYLKALAARIAGFEVLAIIEAAGKSEAVLHYCFTRTEALDWMRQYGVVAMECSIWRFGKMESIRFPRMGQVA